jgi:hypothetical protein
MPCFSDDAKTILTDGGKTELYDGLEKNYTELLAARVDFVEYGDPETLEDRRRAKLNSDLLKQVLVYRAEQLMTATGTMLTQKNLYGLALIVRGHIETLAVLGYFTRRLDSLTKETSPSSSSRWTSPMGYWVRSMTSLKRLALRSTS